MVVFRVRLWDLAIIKISRLTCNNIKKKKNKVKSLKLKNKEIFYKITNNKNLHKINFKLRNLSIINRFKDKFQWQSKKRKFHKFLKKIWIKTEDIKIVVNQSQLNEMSSNHQEIIQDPSKKDLHYLQEVCQDKVWHLVLLMIWLLTNRSNQEVANPQKGFKKMILHPLI